MSLSFDSPHWGNNFSFTRRDCLSLALQSLKCALPLLDHPTISDREWFKDGVDEIFEPYLPPAERGES